MLNTLLRTRLTTENAEVPTKSSLEVQSPEGRGWQTGGFLDVTKGKTSGEWLNQRLGFDIHIGGLPSQPRRTGALGREDVSDRWPVEDQLIEYSQQSGQAGRPEAKHTHLLSPSAHSLACSLSTGWLWTFGRTSGCHRAMTGSPRGGWKPEGQRGGWVPAGRREEPEHCQQKVEIERAVRERHD